MRRNEGRSNNFFKHVPLVEHNIIEGIRNNAIGTQVIAEAAKHFGVERFVLISTDKAVRPLTDDKHPEGEIEIAFSGLRPGEKLFEELLVGSTGSE